MNDFRFAFRQLLKNPGFTAVALLTLALGIGANTTVFCWLQNAVFRPLPGVAQQDRVVALCATHGAVTYDCVSYPDLKDFAGLKDTFSGVIGSQITPACVRVNGRLEWAYGQIATANFFDVLGVKPLLGRTFLPDEESKPGGHPVLVLSHGYWQRRFGGRPDVVGTVVELNKHSFTVIGVAPPGFHGTMSGLMMDFWAPLMMHEQVAQFGSLTERGDRWLHTQARLQPGVTIMQAQAAASTLARQLEQTYPNTNNEISLKILRMWQARYGGASVFFPVLRILLVVSIGVLLIVAANVANLLLACAAGREKEIAIRLAMGAGRRRLIRQLLTESVVLALLGAVGGALFSRWAADLIKHLVPNTHLPIGYAFGLDLRTLGFTAALAVVTGLVFGLAPAWKASSPNLNATLKEGGRTTGGSMPHHRLRSALVISEVALALLLLIGAALSIKGFQKARQVDIGFDPKPCLMAGLRVGAHGYTEETALVFYRQLRERLAVAQGVKEAALASWFPLGFEGGPALSVDVEGYQPARGEDVTVSYSIVTPRYFAAMGVPLVDGRDFTEQDDMQAPRAVVINEAMARRFWQGQNPLGRKLRTRDNREARVIGVVRTGKYRFLNEPPTPFMYLCYQQGVWDMNLGVVIRAEREPQQLAGLLRREIQALNPGVEVWALLPAHDYVEAAFLPQRIAATLLLILGVVAVLLAAMGIYGIMAYVVSHRTHEIGVRMALGAGVADILKLIIAQSLRMVLAGVALGLAGASALTRLLSSFLYGVSPFDLATFTGVSTILAAVALFASYLPARRATRVDPGVALRYE